MLGPENMIRDFQMNFSWQVNMMNLPNLLMLIVNVANNVVVYFNHVNSTTIDTDTLLEQLTHDSTFYSYDG